MKMQTLSEPLFELNQESEPYKNFKEKKDDQPRINQIFKEVAEEFGFGTKDFGFYGSRGFGFHQYTDSREKFKDELNKNPDSNGIHKFKLSSKTFKKMSPKLLEVENIIHKVSPFELHDVFGFNNLTASQWIGDRFFVEVKNADRTKELLESKDRRKHFEIEPVKEITYKEYLQLVMNELESERA